MPSLLGGQTSASFVNVNTALPHIRSGRLKALAVTSERRSPVLPKVPTLRETGVAGVEVYSWQAFAAPKGLPEEVKAKLHGAFVAALKEPEVWGKLLEQGFDIVANSPEQFAAFQALEQARWGKVIVNGKITAD